MLGLGRSVPARRRVYLAAPSIDSTDQVAHAREPLLAKPHDGGRAPHSEMAGHRKLTVAIERGHSTPGGRGGAGDGAAARRKRAAWGLGRGSGCGLTGVGDNIGP